MDKDLILTCDAGTTGCKCTIISPTGEAISSVRRSYPTTAELGRTEPGGDPECGLRRHS